MFILNNEKSMNLLYFTIITKTIIIKFNNERHLLHK